MDEWLGSKHALNLNCDSDKERKKSQYFVFAHTCTSYINYFCLFSSYLF